MVSSYLRCDWCGQLGPPASNYGLDSLRLCYQCWYEAQRAEGSPAADATPADADSALRPEQPSPLKPDT